MQNRHHRGSYSYDDTLNRISNSQPVGEPNHRNNNIEIDVQNDRNAVNRQRRMLQYFAQNI